MSFVAYTLPHLPGRYNEEQFSEHRGVNIEGKRIKCILFADDVALLEEDETDGAK